MTEFIRTWLRRLIAYPIFMTIALIIAVGGWLIEKTASKKPFILLKQYHREFWYGIDAEETDD